MDVWDKSETRKFESSGRRLDALEMHVDEMKANKLIMEEFERFCALYEYYSNGDGSCGVQTFDREKLLSIYGLFRSNAFCVKDGKLVPLGCGIYPNLRRLKHSCRPNARIVYQGRRAKVVLFVDPDPDDDGRLIKPDVRSYEEITCSYVDELMSPEKKREKLRETHFFDCECRVCEGTNEEDRRWAQVMDGLRCDAEHGCDGVATWMVTKDGERGHYECVKCSKRYDNHENVEIILQLTKDVLDSPQSKQRLLLEPRWAKEILANLACMQMPTLHRLNVYRVRTIRESYETACRLANWADAAAYGRGTLDAYKYYLNEYSDPEYATMAFNAAKAMFNGNLTTPRAKSNPEMLELLRACRRCFEYAYGPNEEQTRETVELIGFCEQMARKENLEEGLEKVEKLKSMLDQMLGKK